MHPRRESAQRPHDRPGRDRRPERAQTRQLVRQHLDLREPAPRRGARGRRYRLQQRWGVGGGGSTAESEKGGAGSGQGVNFVLAHVHRCLECG